MPETELLYMKDVESNYIHEFESRVFGAGPGWVVLDRTAFYPAGGGQPSDTGSLLFDGGKLRVREVQKRGAVRHILDEDLPSGVEHVRGVLDWGPRYAHMRMHTAQHLLSATVFDLFGARTVGNQIRAESSHIDFAPVRFDPERLQQVEARCNDMLARGTPVTIYEEDRTVAERQLGAERVNWDLLPASVKRLRMVGIGEFDLCPCAGTHVRNTGEIGRLSIVRRESKGQDRERLTYILEKPG